ncbi:hypothetical protein AMJ86_07060, partial [bacterium SM23_57]
MTLICCVALASDPLEAVHHSPVSVSLEEIDAASLGMTVNCPDEPLQYLQQGNDRRVWLEFESEGTTIDEGKANLPLITRFIAIPPNTQLRANVISRQTSTFEDVSLVPVVTDADDPQTRSWIDNDQWLHSDEAYPPNPVTVGQGMRLRNLWIVPVTVSPTRYYPSDRRLEIDNSIEIQLSLETSNFRDPSIMQGPLVESFHRLYSNIVANYDLLEIDQQPIRGTYLIICYDYQGYIDEIQDLIEWKHRKGYPVFLATTTETGTSTSSIRDYIRNAYENWDRPPEFVCIIGDASGSYSIPTASQYDHYYSMMDGDLLADVFVGRLSVDNSTTLRTVVNKIMHYEKEPYMTATHWYQRGMMVAGSGSGVSPIHTKRSIRWRMLQHGYVQVDSMWYTMGGSITSAIANAFNSGISILNYRGWLGMSGWSNTNTNSLSNGYMLPIVITLTCGTGTFNSGTSLTEGFLRAGSPTLPKGGIASIGTATSGTHTRYNNCMDVGVFAGIFDEGMPHLGEALARGKLELARNYPGNGTAISHIYWNNLMGDPGLVMWLQVPIPLTVDYQDTVSLGTNVFEIHVEDDNNLPVQDAYVCLWQQDETLYELAYTDENGNAQLNCGDALLGEFLVTVTKQGYIPHLGQSIVTTASQSLGISSAPVDDDTNGQSQGNGDGFWNPNERVEIQPTLWNRGTQQIENIQATLLSEDPLLTVIQSTGSFGTIQAGDSAQMTTSFLIDLDPSTPDGYLCRLQMDVVGTSFSQTLFLDYNTVSYQLEVRQITVDDGANGLLEPGETSDILIRI